MKTIAEKIEEKAAKRKKLMPISLGAIFTSVALFIIALATENDAFIFVSVLLMMASLIAGVLYLLFFGGFYKCYKRLGGRDVELLAEGIVEARPTLRKNKNVYFGKNAMYLKRTCALLPYSDIGWIYVHRQTAVAIIPIITETVIIRTKFGDQLEISIKREDLLAVLQHLVLPSNPQILVGFNEENKKTYNELVKDVKKLSSNYDYQK